MQKNYPSDVMQNDLFHEYIKKNIKELNNYHFEDVIK